MTHELLTALGDGGPIAQGMAVLVMLLTVPLFVLACRKSQSPWTLPLTLLPTWVLLGVSTWGVGQGLTLLIEAITTYARATHGTVVRASLDTLFGVGMTTGIGLTVFGCVGALATGLGALARRETGSPVHAIAPVAIAGVAASAFPEVVLVVALCTTATAAWLFASAVTQSRGTAAARLAVGAHCLIGTLGVALYYSVVHTRSVVQLTVMAAPADRSQVLLQGLAEASSMTAWVVIGTLIVATIVAVVPVVKRPRTAHLPGWVLFATTLVVGIVSLSWQSNTTRRATTELLSLDQRAATAELALNDVYLPRVPSAPAAASGPSVMVSRDVITLDRRYLGPPNAQTATILLQELPATPAPQLSVDRDLPWVTLRPVLQALHDAGHSRVFVRVTCADDSVGNVIVNVSDTGFRPPEDFMWLELINRAVGSTSWAVSLYVPRADPQPSNDEADTE
ncbi:MAG: hypothetical protein ACJATT_001238 [Myxococcota bacterium]|jgi:hypothetical protein